MTLSMSQDEFRSEGHHFFGNAFNEPRRRHSSAFGSFNEPRRSASSYDDERTRCESNQYAFNESRRIHNIGLSAASNKEASLATFKRAEAFRLEQRRMWSQKEWKYALRFQ